MDRVTKRGVSIIAGRLLGATALAALAAGAAQAQTAPTAAGAQQAQPPGPDPTRTPDLPRPIDSVGGTTVTDATAAPVGVQATGSTTAPDIVVTGFRQSINSALAVKRNSTSAVDAIVAEDIANFPDQNLAESLQRIPGISISRSGGEGRNITVRGLGPDFTRVRLNGMETVATSGGSNGRGFDFNVFASDLFNSIVVHKTAEAQLEEGSLGAVVDLNTGNPSSYKKGWTFVSSAKVQYNDLNENFGPRVAGLLAYNSPSGVFAASLSAAYSTYKTTESGDNTVGWQQARFNSVAGVACFTKNRSGGTYVSSPGCDAAALAYHPRIPRYGALIDDRQRLGVTGSVEINPTDRTKISIDGLYSRYRDDHQENFSEVLLRSAERSIDLTDYSIDQNSTLVSGTFNNVQARSEPRASHSVTDFFQVDGKLTQEFSDRFKATLFGGYSKSVANTPHDTTIITDQYGLNGYRYNYGANPTAPLIVLPSAAANLANTYITEFRDSQSRISNNFWTAKLDAEYKLNEQLTIAVGGFYRRFGFGSQSGSRSSTFCAAFTCPAGQIGLPLTDALSDAYTVPGVDYAPAGTTLTYLFPNIGAVVDALDIYGRPLIASNSDTRSVTEKDSGAYFQFNVNSELFGLRYSANAGVRYVNTDQSSTGINNAQSVTINRRYDQFLPEFNLALYPSEKLIIRGAIAKVMRRPGLGDLSPGGSVNGFDYTISYGNPQLDPTIATTFDAAAEWYFDRGSLLSVAYFRKAINSFPIGNRYQGTYASTGLPASLIPATSPAGLDPAGPESRPWTISSTINGPGGLLQGVEVGAQLPFRFLPGPLKNLGFLGNVTYIDSNFTYAISRPAVSATTTSFPQLQPSSIETTFLGASKWSYNATLYYEDARFSLRGSLAYRDAYNTGTGSYGNILDLQASRLSLDVSSRLRINSHVELTAEAINLLNKPDLPYMDLESERTNYYHKTGRVFMAGARLKL